MRRKSHSWSSSAAQSDWTSASLRVEGRVADYRRVIEHAVTRSLSPESKNMPEAGRPILHDAMTSNIAELRRRFAEAKPFPHVLIENFFAADVVSDLIRQFPVPDPTKMVNEFGRGSKKFARHDVRNIGPVYAELDDYIRSPKFAALMSALTGIPGLLYDPEYHGAGTHDNHDGQGMDPHVDFNLHRSTGYHRRINAIIYLNESWDPKWGGNLELHKNPWDPEGDEIIAFPPFKKSLRAVRDERVFLAWLSRSQRARRQGDLTEIVHDLHVHKRETAERDRRQARDHLCAPPDARPSEAGAHADGG